MVQDKPASWKPLPVVGERQAARAEATAAKGTSHDILAGKGVAAETPAATRQELALAEERLKEAQRQFESAKRTMKQKQERIGDIEANIEKAEGKPGLPKLEKELESAKKAERDAVADYRKLGNELRAVESRVEGLTKDLAKSGELPGQGRPAPRSYSDAELDKIARTTPDIRRIRQLASGMNSGNAGSLFERWASQFAFFEKQGARSRLFVKRGENVGLDLERSRSSDFFVHEDGSIWDAKIYQRGEKVDVYQLDDYRKMEEAGFIITTDGEGRQVKRQVNSINYLFADADAAKVNKSLIQVQGGGQVYFIDDRGLLQLLP